MRGPSSAEIRTEKFQTLTSLGLIADDVSLAIMHYPKLSSDESRAVTALSKTLDPDTMFDVIPTSIRRSKAMGDSSAIIQKAVEVDNVSATEANVHAILDDLRVRLNKVSDRTASPEDLQALREFTERLAKITLMLTERFASERGARDWMPKVSDSFAA